MNTVFDDILMKGVRAGQIPARTQAARDWYRNVATSSAVHDASLVKDKTRVASKIEVGSMYMFQYDPKTKEKLPFYDRFPLIFPIEQAPGGFIGINLHYLPHQLRARLMDALHKYASNKKYDQTTMLAVNYKILKSTAKLKFFKPCIKRYLNSHVQSNFIYVFPSEWDIALFLPTERFEKQSMSAVHDHSVRMIYGAR